MGVLAKRLEKHGVMITLEEEDPLRAILRRLIIKQGVFPPVEIRQKHYNADREQRTHMDDITDQLFEEAKRETSVFDGVNNGNAIFNAILKLQLSSMESNAKAKARQKKLKIDLLGKQLQQAELDTEVGTNQVTSSAIVILQEERRLEKASTEVAIVRQVLDRDAEEPELRCKILREKLAAATLKRQTAELKYLEKLKTTSQDSSSLPPPSEASPPVSAAPLVPTPLIPVTVLPIVDARHHPPPQVAPMVDALHHPPPQIAPPPAPLRLPPRRPRAALVQPVTETVPRFKVTNLGPPVARSGTRRRHIEEGGV